jgi:hypothetical protein
MTKVTVEEEPAVVVEKPVVVKETKVVEVQKERDPVIITTTEE